jgi:RimK family alpha-L-glutamate ligase
MPHSLRIAMLGTTAGWHFDQLQSAATAQGHRLVHFSYEQLASTNGSRDRVQCGEDDIASFDLILARTMPLGTLDQIVYRLSILHRLAARGCQVVNAPRCLEWCIDKYATLDIAQQLNIPVPETIVCQDRSTAMQAFMALGGDVVVKPLLGSEGRGIMRVSDRELAWRTFATLAHQGAVLYVQQFVPPGGKDLRILVLGNRMLGLRREHPTDWRTNHSRGSQSRLAEIPSPWQTHARRLAQQLELTYGAIDLVGPDDDLKLLEVNAIPGWMGAQAVCDESIAAMIVDAVTATVATNRDDPSPAPLPRQAAS